MSLLSSVGVKIARQQLAPVLLSLFRIAEYMVCDIWYYIHAIYIYTDILIHSI